MGKKQFFEYQTKGKYKDRDLVDLDIYFQVLRRGKWQFDLISSSYRELYLSGEWPGWFTLLSDWKGKEWILKRLVRWYKGDLNIIFDK
ncbi:MAG: hypothetical protein WC119_02275 [Synergistaceae bacterium]